MTTIRITFQNGDVFDIDAHVVANERANYYAKLDTERGDATDFTAAYKSEYEFTMKDDYELSDWLSNNMNWEDVEPYATRVYIEDKPDYGAWFSNAEKKVIKAKE